MAEVRKVIRIGDVLLNLLDPISKKQVEYSKVTTWYDGSPMNDSKLDTQGIYVKKGSEYFIKSLGEYGQTLQKDTMAEMRGLSSKETLLLRMGYYKHVQLNGYYKKGDTPAPIDYRIFSEGVDDGGSTIVVGGVIFKHEFKDKINAVYFGIKPDYNSDTAIGTVQTFDQVFNACVRYGKIPMEINSGKYLVNKFGRYNDINIIGNSAEIYFRYNSELSVTMVQFGNNTRIENLNFISTELDLPNQRCAIEQATNVYLFNVSAKGFRNPIAKNAWGMYIKNSNKITLDNCSYYNNSQSDIAVVDNCQEITIINPRNVEEGGVYLNVEPNSIQDNIGINVLGGDYRSMTLLVNTAQSDPIQAMNVTSANIKLLRYDGANVKFNNCNVKQLSNEQNANVQMGDLDLNLGFGDNILKDAYIFDIHNNDTTRQWNVSSGTFRVDRVGKNYTTIGDGTSIAGSIKNTNDIPVVAGEQYLVMLNSRGVLLTDSSNISRNMDVRFYDDANVLVSTSACYLNRSLTATANITAWKNQVGVFNVPEGATKMRLIIGNINTSTKVVEVKYISVNKITNLKGDRSIREYIATNMPNGVYKALSPITGSGNVTAGAKLGDVVYNYNPSGIFGWTITSEGKPSTWREIVNVPVATTAINGTVKQSAEVTNSTVADATDLTTALALVNDLKNKLNAKLNADRVSGQQASTT